LPQRGLSPTAFGPAPKTDKSDNRGGDKKTNYQTDSGLLCGRVVMEQDKKSMAVKASMELIPKDFLRIGSEEDSWHQTFSLGKRLPKGGMLTLNAPRHKTPKLGTPVYLIDRREPELTQILKTWQDKLAARRPKFKKDADIPEFQPYTPKPENMRGARRLDIAVRGALPHGRRGKEGIKPGTVQGLWLSPRALNEVSRTLFGRISWWLPPVIWPDEEENWLRNIRQAQRNGARHFVCNSPWQEAMFESKQDLSLTAGPFCNLTNAFALGALARLGYSQAIVSPELSAADFLALPAQSPLPLGVVASGYWPAGITRYPVLPLKPDEVFHSPKREGFWFRQYGQNNWIYPSWPLDLNAYRQQLEKAGYITFVHLQEYPPKELENRPGRTSEFNWKIDVL
jgi:putative protease